MFSPVRCLGADRRLWLTELTSRRHDCFRWVRNKAIVQLEDCAGRPNRIHLHAGRHLRLRFDCARLHFNQVQWPRETSQEIIQEQEKSLSDSVESSALACLYGNWWIVIWCARAPFDFFSHGPTNLQPQLIIKKMVLTLAHTIHALSLVFWT